MTQRSFSFPADRRPWTSSEIARMRAHANLGTAAVAELLGRSVRSVKNKAHRERISLRGDGYRGGLIVGQSRSSSWMSQSGMSPRRLAEIREQVIAGNLDIGELERRVIDAVRNPQRPLCPWCGTRPIQRQTTGLCEPCHLRELARAHRDEAARIEAHRDLDAARQQASRARRKTAEVTVIHTEDDE